MTKILVVDDESDLEILVKQKFRKKIRENEYEFIFATNGLHALEQLKKHQDIDIVLSDINMPEMDGLTLLSKLSEQHSLLKAVIISAYGDMENIRSAMNKGAFDFITKPVDFTDLEVTLDKTIKQVEQIRKTLRAIKENNILKMYVDETVLNFMDTSQFETSIMSNETIEASVAFIDICDFTAISENKSPDGIVKLLNSYFEVMVNEIIAHGGSIDKFIGDAIMTVIRCDSHANRAIEACLAVRKKINELPPVNDNIEFKPSVSIGINTGEMVSGNIGSISLKRLDYTVIGDTVNTAQRMQASAKPNQIVISENLYKKVNKFFKCEMVGDINFKNKSQAIRVYQVFA